MKITNWNNVFAGDIVQFRYKSKEGRSGNRTVICLDPRYRYRKQSTGRVVELFVGLQIDVLGSARVLTTTEVKRLVELLGESDQDLAKVNYNDEARLRKIYTRLKMFLKKNDVFRTFLYRECRKRNVFLLDKYSELNRLQIEQLGKQLINERRTIGELEVSEEGI